MTIPGKKYIAACLSGILILAIAAVTDVRLALALVTALDEPETNKQTLEVLTAKAEKARKRQAEAKAHARNVRKGKK